MDSVRGSVNVTCPRGTPGPAQCFVLVESGQSAQLGAVTVEPVLDIEYPTGAPSCGAPRSFGEELLLSGGNLSIRIKGPYLCLGEESTTQRDFRVTAGTGRFAGDTGSGTILFTTLPVGAAETWTGNLLKKDGAPG